MDGTLRQLLQEIVNLSALVEQLRAELAAMKDAAPAAQAKPQDERRLNG